MRAFVGQRFGIGDTKLKVFRCDTVGQRGRFIEIAYGDHRAIVAPACSGDGAALERFESFFNGLCHGAAKFCVCRDQKRLGAFVMFRLAHQVQGDPIRVVIRICDDQNFGRASDHINAHFAKNPTFGGCDKSIARSGYFINGRNGFRAIGQRGNRLSPANAIHFVNAGNLGRQHHQRVYNAVRCRHGNGKPFHPGNLGWDSVHQHRRRIGGKTAGHIEPRCRNRSPAPAKLCAALIRPAFILGHLTAVISADTRGRQL